MPQDAARGRDISAAQHDRPRGPETRHPAAESLKSEDLNGWADYCRLREIPLPACIERIAVSGTRARGSYLYFGEFGRLDCVIGVGAISLALAG
jgi:hypothetical protein